MHAYKSKKSAQEIYFQFERPVIRNPLSVNKQKMIRCQ